MCLNASKWVEYAYYASHFQNGNSIISFLFDFKGGQKKIYQF